MNGRASGPVLTSLFLFVPDHSAAPTTTAATFPLRSFTLQFVPVLVETYLFACSLGRGGGDAGDSGQVDVTPVETLLLSIYNLDVTHANGRPKVSVELMRLLLGHSLVHSLIHSLPSS